jgi:hypothetical protein
MKCCQHITPVLAQAVQTAADLERFRAENCSAGVGTNQLGAEHGWGSILQLPVQHSECGKLLQDGVCLVSAAAAAAAPSAAMQDLGFLLQCVGTPLGYQPGGSVLASSGPLVAPAAAAGD